MRLGNRVISFELNPKSSRTQDCGEGVELKRQYDTTAYLAQRPHPNKTCKTRGFSPRQRAIPAPRGFHFHGSEKADGVNLTNRSAKNAGPSGMVAVCALTIYNDFGRVGRAYSKPRSTHSRGSPRIRRSVPHDLLFCGGSLGTLATNQSM
jgi:hypothetical protein